MTIRFRGMEQSASNLRAGRGVARAPAVPGPSLLAQARPAPRRCRTRTAPGVAGWLWGFATACWVEWYNNGRLHSSPGMVPPVEPEQANYATLNPRRSQYESGTRGSPARRRLVQRLGGARPRGRPGRVRAAGADRGDRRRRRRLLLVRGGRRRPRSPHARRRGRALVRGGDRGPVAQAGSGGAPSRLVRW